MTLNTRATSNWHWISGTADPSPFAGYVHDFFINTTSGEVFEKTAETTWTYRGVWAEFAPTGGNISLTFTAANWSGDNLTVIPSGVPGPGQVGPHNIPTGQIIHTKIQMKTGVLYEDVFIESDYDITTNTILLKKSSTVSAFDGSILLSYGS
jgi:hypothetical protein